MYLLPICMIIMASIFLIIQIRYFLMQLKKSSQTNLPNLTNRLNYIGLISSFSVAILSIIYLFIINNQL